MLLKAIQLQNQRLTGYNGIHPGHSGYVSPLFGKKKPKEPLATGVSKSVATVVASAAAESPSSASDKKNNTLVKTQPGSFKKYIRAIWRILLNLFHIGAAAFVVGAGMFLPFSMPAIIGSLIGVTILQKIALRIDPDVDVNNPEKMRQISKAFLDQYDKVAAMGELILGKIPLIRKPAVWLYKKGNLVLRRIVEKSSKFLMEQLVHKSVKVSRPPQSFWGWSWFTAKLALEASVHAITGPFGKAGVWLYQGIVYLFSLQDAQNITKTLTDKEFSKAALKKNEAKTQTPQGI